MSWSFPHIAPNGVEYYTDDRGVHYHWQASCGHYHSEDDDTAATDPGSVATTDSGTPVDPPASLPPSVPPQQASNNPIQIPVVIPESPFVSNPFSLDEFLSQGSGVKIVSQESGYAPFETLFHDLKLQATPTYNFWERNEDISAVDRGSTPLDELPRYIYLSWQQAPDLKDPSDYKKFRLDGSEPGVRDFNPIAFGLASWKPVIANGAGQTWSIDYLNPDSFDQTVAMTSNGFIAPGVIEGVVDVDVNTITLPPIPSSALVDEDEFLAHPELFDGISYPEFNAAVWRRTSRAYGSQLLSTQELSPPAQLNQQTLFNGQFSTSVPRVTDVNDPVSYIDVRAVSAQGPAIGFAAQTANADVNIKQPRIFELAQSSGDSTVYAPEKNNVDSHQRVKVKLVHTNLQGMMSTNRINTANQPQHAESIVALAPFAGNLALYAASGYQSQQRQITLPSLPAPATLKPFEYTGYVIEKYEQVNGSFKLVDTINIPGRDFDEYVDSAVKYGATYRYRIKTIFRWSHSRSRGVFGPDPSVASSVTAGLNPLLTNEVNFFASEWAKEWATAMTIDTSPPTWPDEFRIRPDSEKGSVDISMKLPYNPQKDICRMLLWRKVQDMQGRDKTGWVQIQEFDSVDRQGTLLEFSKNYIHEQDDITGTKWSEREQKYAATFAEFAPINSRFVDTDIPYFGDGSNYRFVYAATCVSRHGEMSALSDQLACRLNTEWKKEGEFPVIFISCGGVDKDLDTGNFTTIPEWRTRTETIAGTHEHLLLTGQSRMAKRALNNNLYTVRVESLDNGQRIDIPVNIEVNNMPTETIESSVPVLYQSTT